MRIGIITQPLHTNYGGLLQNYALQQALKRLGHEPITLDQDFYNPSILRIYLACIKTFILRLFGKGKNRTYPYHVSKTQKSTIRKNTDYFINKYIVKTQVLDTIEQFRKSTIDKQLDALVVGSDQVWRPIYNRNVLCSFFDFAKDLSIKRLAYAASFGVDFWEFSQQQTEQAKELIRDFDAVSVREHSGIDLCRKYLYCDAVHVLDPTMLLDKEDYIRLVEEENEPISKGNLFTYILDESDEKKLIIEKVATELNLQPFTSMPKHKINKDTIKIDLKDCIYPPVTQWLYAFMDAKFVVCDSFHGAVFSVIFNKPFLIIGNKERGMTRFYSLLDTFGLRNRMIDSITDVELIVDAPINWEKVNQIREKMKNYSLEYLKINLK